MLEQIKKTDISFPLLPIIWGHACITYRGTILQKSPFDYVLFRMVIEKIKPDLIIEIGCQNGGGALYMADIMEKIGDGSGIVHTIDVQDARTDLVKEHPRIKYFGKGWQNYDITNAEGFKNIMVIDDGAHNYLDCIGALRKFSHLVPSGGSYIVEDGIVSRYDWKMFDGGPQRAIDEFFAENDDFKVDRFWCDFFGENATFNMNGYLKKK